MLRYPKGAWVLGGAAYSRRQSKRVCSRQNRTVGVRLKEGEIQSLDEQRFAFSRRGLSWSKEREALWFERLQWRGLLQISPSATGGSLQSAGRHHNKWKMADG